MSDIWVFHVSDDAFISQSVVVYNDHKPLEEIFKKPLLSSPMRLQRMLLKLQRYDLEVNYCRGSEMVLPDTLSRAPLPDTDSEAGKDLEPVNMFQFLAITSGKYLKIQEATLSEMSLLCDVIASGWPDSRKEVPAQVRPYFDSRTQLAVSDSVVYKGMRLVIPPSLRPKMLSLIHESHLGVTKCKQRAHEVMYWPSMNSDIEETVRNCCKCAEYQRAQQLEPLLPTYTPDLPFIEVGSDIF